ncbi:MAG: L-fucokinase [Paludibaculum sp.]
MPDTDPARQAETNGVEAAAQWARSRYVARIASASTQDPWWDAVVVTAGSARQAEKFSEEIVRRRMEGRLPAGVLYLTAPDLDDSRLGSGGATLNALRILAEGTLLNEQPEPASLEAWWEQRRVLIIQGGGDPRRLPQYALSGRLFAPLPAHTPWGGPSTAFDEILASSTAWAARIRSGIVVCAGDVLIDLDDGALSWDRPGIRGAAIVLPAERAAEHGVYSVDESGRVYAFLSKPTRAEMEAAGALTADGTAAIDTGLLAFDAASCARLSELAGIRYSFGRWLTDHGILAEVGGARPFLDLYQHVTTALTGQWAPAANAPAALRHLAVVLQGLAFHCSLVPGRLQHIGSDGALQGVALRDAGLAGVYRGQRRTGSIAASGVESAGVVIDSVFGAGCRLDSGAMAIECNLDVPVRAAQGAVLRGLTGLRSAVEIPEGVIVHQIPVRRPGTAPGVVFHVYGVADHPERPMADATATWFGRPIVQVLAGLELDAEEVWPGVAEGQRSLWNASLFGCSDLESAWKCAQWLMGLHPPEFDVAAWRAMAKLSLAASEQGADAAALAEARAARMQTGWQRTAMALARDGSDIRPMLALSPGIPALAATGRALAADAATLERGQLTEAASRHFQASLFLGQAGLAEEAGEAHDSAFRCVRAAVEASTPAGIEPLLSQRAPKFREVHVSAPPRIDLGGGWSDTPPFCFDWGGTVLNLSLALDGGYPIRTSVRVLDEPLVRCIADGERAEFRSAEEVLRPPAPGDPFSIPRVALRMLGWNGLGLEIRTAVDLPMGSGLGTSSILAATVLRALAELAGSTPTDAELSDQVMTLEQRMTTGGGWQDQAGGIFPGAKLISSGPGLRQRLRVQPVGWSAQRQEEFQRRFVLHYTGIRRIAKGLLTQVVGGYLAREVGVVQVLHSIKTLAVEMAYAMREGEWGYLGELMQRHWLLNQQLDPHTTNAPINQVLGALQPYLAGAKLAGAGGGGFLMLLAKDEEAAGRMKAVLRQGPGRVYEWAVAEEGLRVEQA